MVAVFADRSSWYSRGIAIIPVIHPPAAGTATAIDTPPGRSD